MGLPRGIARFNARVLNPLVLRLAGHGPLVDVEHVGRRSGRRHHTPVLAFRSGGTVTIALTYGPDVEWLTNIRAAGGARMHMRGEILTLGPPRALEREEGLSRVPAPLRAILRWPVRCRHFVALPVRRVRRVH